MQINCSSCKAPYNIEEKRLPPGGAKMRCPKCGTTFRVAPSSIAAQPGVALPQEATRRASPLASQHLAVEQRDVERGQDDEGATNRPPPHAVRVGSIHDPAPPAMPSMKANRPAPPPPPPPRKPSFPPKQHPADLPALREKSQKASPAGSRPQFDPDLPAALKSQRGADLPAVKSAQEGMKLRATTRSVSALPELDADLPALSIPAPARLGQPASRHGIDLPAVSTTSGGRASEPSDPFNLDLPQLVESDPQAAYSRDVPALKHAHRSAGAEVEEDVLDLPSPLGLHSDATVVRPGSDTDATVAYPPSDARLDQPMMSFELDLPSPLERADLPVAQESQGLPRARGNSGLPAPLPMDDVAEGHSLQDTGLEFDGLDLAFSDPPASGAAGKAQVKARGVGSPDEFGSGDVFGELDLDGSSDSSAEHGDMQGRPGMEDASGSMGAGGFGSDNDADAFAELFGAPEQSGADVPSAQGMGEGFDLEDGIGAGFAQEFDGLQMGADSSEADDELGFGEVDLGLADDEDPMEFADIPEALGDGPLDVAVDPLAARQEAPSAPKGEASKVSAIRRFMPLIIAAGVLVVLGAAGVALGFTRHGYFGMYAIERFLPGAGSVAEARQVISTAEGMVVADTYASRREALKTLASARNKMGLNRLLWTKSLFHESFYQLRFGDDVASTTRMTAIVQRLRDRKMDAPMVALGMAAYEAEKNEFQAAASYLASARNEHPNDPMLELLAGEIALRQRKIDDAMRAFQSALRTGGGTAAQWGLARAQLHDPDGTKAKATIELITKRNPAHVGARLATARWLWKHEKESNEVIADLMNETVGSKKVGQQSLGASKKERSDAWSLLALVYEDEGRIGEAIKAFDNAVQLDAVRAEALLGSGRVLLRDKRPADALARFEAVINSKVAEKAEPLTFLGGRDHAVHSAKIGAAEAMLALDRPQSAKDMMSALAAELSEDPEVMLWLGKSEEALKSYDDAEKHYREAMRLNPDDFSGYLALSELYFATQRSDDAAKILREAEGQVADSAERRRMLGRAELLRGKVDAALTQFRAALSLDPKHLPSRFDLGVGLRHAGKLDEARTVLSVVEKSDPSFPGLAVERGLIYEARGQWDEALQNYRTALEKNPNDTNLLLRMGASQVEAGHVEAAAETLAKVKASRPNSAEVAYFLGRVAFNREQIDEAISEFRRATVLDSKQGEYFLYAGWASFKLGTNYGSALDYLSTAITLDPGLADAYWVRGKIMLQTGAVKNARDDFMHAIKLKPSRFQAYADLGDAYDQLRNGRQAIESYTQAVAQDPQRGDWWQRLGALYIDNGKVNESLSALGRALSIGDQLQEPPVWLAEAHRLMAEALVLSKRRSEAMKHYERYLQLAPPTAIDRNEIEAIMRTYGQDGID